MSKSFNIVGMEKPKIDTILAKQLLDKPFHSVHDGLIGSHPNLGKDKSIAGFILADVISVLGERYHEILNDAGVANATVPKETAEKWGYQGAHVLLDFDRLYGISKASKHFAVRSPTTPTAG